MLKPVSLSCGHSGCHDCLRELTKKTAVPKCPMCRREFRAASIAENIALEHVTSELQVECLTRGCGWKGRYGWARDHFHNCPKFEIQCKNKGCRYQEIRENMPLHEQSCSKREIPCSNCNQSVTCDLLQLHQRLHCPNTLTACPLDCGETLPRSSINLHLHVCAEKATSCKVKGCSNIMKRKVVSDHLVEAAQEHFQLQSGEINSLKQAIYSKTYGSIGMEVQVEKVYSFCWSFSNFAEVLRNQTAAAGKEPLTSAPFEREGQKWRGLLSRDSNLFLQLVAASHPVTTEIRFVMAPGKANESVFSSNVVTLKQGEMWGKRMSDMKKWVDRNGRLDIKFVVYYMSLQF